MGLDPTAPEMTLLLVMLHTGTMFAVIVFFWRSWRASYFGSAAAFRSGTINLLIGTAATGVVGLVLLQLITRLFAQRTPGFEIEHLFGNAGLMAASLAAAGLLILFAARLGGAAGEVRLKLIVHLVRRETLEREYERIPYEPLTPIDAPISL